MFRSHQGITPEIVKRDSVTLKAFLRYYIVERELEVEQVSRLRAGDSAASDEIYSVFSVFNRRLMNFLARMARNKSVAEDLLEETWLRLVSAGEDLRADTHLAPWLFTVARNLYISYCRSRLRETAYTADLVFLWPCEMPRTPFDLASLGEFEERLGAAVADLPPICREVILPVGVEQLRPVDAAEVCGISPESLRQRLKRARDLLSGSLKQDSAEAPGEEVSHVTRR